MSKRIKFGGNPYISHDAQQLIQPDRPQLAFHQRLSASVRLCGRVGRRVRFERYAAN
jgi:hypothetical protein